MNDHETGSGISKKDIALWNRIADKYSKKPLANPDATQAKLGLIKAELSPEDVVLDLGCGTGTIALELAPHVRKVIAVDVSSEMLRIAQEKTEKAGVTNIEYRCLGVLEALYAVSTQSIDVVCTFNILHLMEDWRGATQEIARVLKTGGFFSTSTECLADSWLPLRAIIGAMRIVGKAPKVAFIREPELTAALSAGGFSEVQRHDVGAGKTTVFVTARKD